METANQNPDQIFENLYMKIKNVSIWENDGPPTQRCPDLDSIKIEPSPKTRRTKWGPLKIVFTTSTKRPTETLTDR